MKILFVGPTVPDAARIAGDALAVRPPATQGDLVRAVNEGATAIGLIDGNFEYVAPVWHKEILFALSQGVAVLGAASMGALRAAECAPFGMVGIGAVFRQYIDGETVDDSDVALLHAPRELGYAPLTVPLVNLRATLRHLTEQNLLSHSDAARTADAAASLFYKERSWAAIFARAGFASGTDAVMLRANYVDQKRIDALELLEALQRMPAERRAAPRDWNFNATSLWTTMLSRLPPFTEMADV
ncbi:MULTISPECIES: TfuA-like protein [Sinorhizobium]|uniref:Antibiotic resistance protein n=2 Tax=Sinorhizobium TaxID=28105 RepID=A0A2S3YRT1_9HYPH|nr:MULTISPECIES: TfuA-like protein [Sinorhizobium]AUX80337.1 TfuA-like domain-containing protein [Sinorhizobium fredii]PDT43301.1 antibiotic resistance protein [Sinorhizobium sp. FG01]PDT52847.1 antibiotic resistance protein [Sinorhizobium sp. NG07B]POH29018.1 antibiotic resistance protein [Sinorhizobium americanum]POH34303.1 antibiotic resistance protein [Sinorhizobium americanum]